MPELIVAGVLLIVLGIWQLLETVLQVFRCNRQVTGKVAYVDTKPEIGANGHGFRDCYFPVYEYEVDGQVYQSPGAEYSSEPDYFKVNAKKQIKYNPNNPSECIIDRKLKKAVIGIIFLAAGGVVLLFGIWL